MSSPELTPDQQLLEVVQEFRSQALYYRHGDEEVRQRALPMINALLDEYNDRILPQLILITGIE